MSTEYICLNCEFTYSSKIGETILCPKCGSKDRELTTIFPQAAGAVELRRLIEDHPQSATVIKLLDETIRDAKIEAVREHENRREAMFPLSTLGDRLCKWGRVLICNCEHAEEAQVLSRQTAWHDALRVRMRERNTWGMVAIVNRGDAYEVALPEQEQRIAAIGQPVRFLAGDLEEWIRKCLQKGERIAIVEPNDI